VGLQVGSDLDTATVGVVQRLQTGLQLDELALELAELLQVLRGVQITKGAVSLAVQALAREAALPGVACDIAASSEEDTGSTGEPLEWVYDTHG
jgi:hypothetical protein